MGDRLTYYRGRSTGFDYLRLGLALAVVCWHCYYLNNVVHEPPFMVGVAFRLVMPMFFALSGFLISGSITRIKTLGEFLTLRAIRILPALTVEVMISAVVIGALFTTLPLAEYFSDNGFYKYFSNIYGNIQFKLPGVFADNPRPRVNQSLWTIPYELECYLAISLLWIFGVVGSRRWLLAFVVVAQIALPVRDIWRGEFDHYTHLSGRMLVLSFLYGVLIYAYRDRIVIKNWIMALALVTSLALLTGPETSYFVALPAAYLTVALGLTNPRTVPIAMDGDYSYGIYLYAAPIQQAVVALFPGHREYWFNFLMAIVPICACAAFSWHVIEKPILGRRKSLVASTARLVDWIAGPMRARRRRNVATG